MRLGSFVVQQRSTISACFVRLFPRATRYLHTDLVRDLPASSVMTHNVSEAWFKHECEQDIFERARGYGTRTAIVDDAGSYTYATFLQDVNSLSSKLISRETSRGSRVVFLYPPGYDFAVVLWAAWRAKCIAVPLAVSYPPPELEYVIKDCGASVALCHSSFEALMRPVTTSVGIPLHVVAHSKQPTIDGPKASSPDDDTFRAKDDDGAIIIYTSGTTGRPKGVVTTHGALKAQVAALIGAWGWSSKDRLLHVLPLHHVHGLMAGLTCCLWAGATCEFLSKFNPDEVWRRLSRIEHPITIFMAVPAIYAKLVSAYDHYDHTTQEKYTEGVKRLRVMISGSAALPEPVMERFRQISGHLLLERYGMTEIGLAISNPLKGERIPGSVGTCVSGYQARIVVTEDGKEREASDGEQGELRMKGPGVFREYWQRPEATAKEFDAEGWFKTGDVAVRTNGIFKILGRSSVDILKTGGYKVSALDIERELLTLPSIAEAAVVGVPDDEWGERVGAIVALKPGHTLTLDELRKWGKEKMAPYKVPSLLKVMDAIPRNAMGKFNKKELVTLFAE
mmetsp:Transcript_35345/g.57200  ORF Transcript_35345/g.57200 Transcript_35345/m.57200 type:complete len:565 (+) Transcript_35345:30-1724(+)